MPTEVAGAAGTAAGTGTGAGAAAGAGAGAGAGAAAGAAGTGDGAAAGAAGTGDGAAAGKFDWATLRLDADTQAVVDKHQWTNPGEVVKSYSNLHKLTGLPPDRLLKIPNDKSTPEEWKEFHTRLGVPAKPEEYQLPVPQGDKGEFAAIAAKAFHEAGIPKAAAGKVVTWWNNFQAEQVKAAEAKTKEAHTAQITELKGEWGAQYDQNSVVVDNAAAKFGMTKDQLSALKQVMGPKGALKFLYEIGSKLGVEGEFVGGDKNGNNEGFQANMSPQAAQAEITRLKADRAFGEQFNSKDPVVRSQARALLDRLNRLAAPGEMQFAGPKR